MNHTDVTLWGRSYSIDDTTEIKFFENMDVSIYIPFILTLLNIPTIFFDFFRSKKI